MRYAGDTLRESVVVFNGDVLTQVDLRQHVPIEDYDRFAQRLARIPHGARGAERRRLDDVANAQAGLAAVAEELFDASRLVVQAQHHLVDLGYLLEEIELVVEEGPLEDRDNRFGGVDRQRPKPRALAPCQQDRLHREPPMISCDFGGP